MRHRLTEIGVACPRWAQARLTRTSSSLRRARSAGRSWSRRPGVATTARACASSPPRRARGLAEQVGSRRRGGRAARRRPARSRSGSTSPASSPCSSPAARPARPRPGRWWRPCRPTASAPRCSPRRRTSTPTSAGGHRGRAAHRRGPRRHRGDRGRDVRGARRRDGHPDLRRQRAGHAAAQQRPLEHGRGGHRAVRAAPAGRARPAAGRPSAARARGPSWPTSSAATTRELYPAYRHLMARDPGLKVHLYGKGVRPGRKIGHVNVSGTDLADAPRARGHAADYLAGSDHRMSERVRPSQHRPAPRRARHGQRQRLARHGDGRSWPWRSSASPTRPTSSRRTGCREEMIAYGQGAAAPRAAGHHRRRRRSGPPARACSPAVTPLPVIGVPVPLKHLDGMDSLLSIVQMPAGVPVATVSIGGARNAGLLAARILGVGHRRRARRGLRERMAHFQAGPARPGPRQGGFAA